MKYQQPRFTLPATEGTSTLCESSGQHAMPDRKGKCIRCGEKMDANARLRSIYSQPIEQPSDAEIAEWKNELILGPNAR